MKTIQANKVITVPDRGMCLRRLSNLCDSQITNASFFYSKCFSKGKSHQGHRSSRYFGEGFRSCFVRNDQVEGCTAHAQFSDRLEVSRAK
jgi:hypothetical protein